MRRKDKISLQDKELSEELEAQLPEIARLYYVEHLSVSAILSRLKSARYTHAAIQHAIDKIDEKKIVTISIHNSTVEEKAKSLRILRQALADQFDLEFDFTSLVWNLTPTKADKAPDASSPTQHNMGQEASILINNFLKPPKRAENRDKQPVVNTVVVGPGRAVGLAMSHVQSHRPKLQIVPFTGMMGIKRLNASPIANCRLLEQATGSESLFWFNAPAVIPHGPEYQDVHNKLKEIGILKTISETYENADLVITSVGAEKRVLRWITDMGMEDAVDKYNALLKKDDKPVGSISGALIDSNGKDYQDDHSNDMPWIPLGFTIKQMGDMVSAGKRVLLIAGDDDAHVEAIYALVKNKKVNALVTDTKTARLLLERDGCTTLQSLSDYENYFASGARASRREEKE